MALQAIIVRYVRPGSVRGARLVAECQAGRVSIGYPHGAHMDDKPRIALQALCAKLDAPDVEKGRPAHWGALRWIHGYLKNGDSVFVADTAPAEKGQA